MAAQRVAQLVRHLNPQQAEYVDDDCASGLRMQLTSGGGSVFSGVQQAPEDPILGVTVAFQKDPSPQKVNLGVGAYRTEEGKPLVLQVVKKAESLLAAKNLDHEYLPIAGLAAFNALSLKLILGDNSPAIQQKRVVTVQCLSGTGSLRVGAEFLAKHYPRNKVVYLPSPTWGNHNKIFPNGGIPVKPYRYYLPSTRGLDFQGMCEDLKSAPDGSVILLHACAHNPTGVDPTKEQWATIRAIIRSKGHLPFFDSAYQGFASGSLDEDAFAVRLFVEDGGECVISQSYAKNLGLYGERVGALSIVCSCPSVISRVESQLKLVIRPMYSNPPAYGARIVAAILSDRQLFQEWTVELSGMAHRIIRMRQELYDALQARGTPGDWTHILKQIGMFTFTGLSKAQVAMMTRDFHIYMTSDGRISMAGLNSRTVPHLADAIHAAVTRMG